jgi:hypothetical protein
MQGHYTRDEAESLGAIVIVLRFAPALRWRQARHAYRLIASGTRSAGKESQRIIAPRHGSLARVGLIAPSVLATQPPTRRTAANNALRPRNP